MKTFMNIVGFILLAALVLVVGAGLAHWADHTSSDVCVIKDLSVVHRKFLNEYTIFLGETITSYRLSYVGTYRLSGSLCEQRILVTEKLYQEAEEQNGR